MRIYGLIGYPLSHSWSAQYFADKFSQNKQQNESYRLFPLRDLRDFPALLSSFPDLYGLNVTIPYKEKIMTYLDEIDDTAKQIGAVNTIKIIRHHNQVLSRGYNTDADGFMSSLPSGLSNMNALVLGTGGASKAICHSLQQLGMNYRLVSRKPENDRMLSYHDLNTSIISKFLLIINTTPLGMFPRTETYPPIPYSLLTPFHFLYDLIYNPPVTSFLKYGKEKGTKVKNGLEMLINQADLSYTIFQ